MAAWGEEPGDGGQTKHMRSFYSGEETLQQKVFVFLTDKSKIRVPTLANSKILDINIKAWFSHFAPPNCPLPTSLTERHRTAEIIGYLQIKNNQ